MKVKTKRDDVFWDLPNIEFEDLIRNCHFVLKRGKLVFEPKDNWESTRSITSVNQTIRKWSVKVKERKDGLHLIFIRHPD